MLLKQIPNYGGALSFAKGLLLTAPKQCRLHVEIRPA